MLHETLQAYMKQTQRAPRLRTTNLWITQSFIARGIKRTTLGVVESGDSLNFDGRRYGWPKWPSCPHSD